MDPVKARVLVVNSLFFLDILVDENDHLEAVQAKIRAQLGWPAEREFAIHGAPGGDLHWVAAVEASHTALMGGAQAVVDRLASNRSLVPRRARMHPRVNPRVGDAVQLLVVVKKREPATLLGYGGWSWLVFGVLAMIIAHFVAVLRSLWSCTAVAAAVAVSVAVCVVIARNANRPTLATLKAVGMMLAGVPLLALLFTTLDSDEMKAVKYLQSVVVFYQAVVDAAEELGAFT